MNGARSSSFRSSQLLSDMKKKKTEKHKSDVKRLRGRYLFRATVRRVLDHMEWIKDGDSEDITANIDAPGRERTSHKIQVMLKNRSMLLTEPKSRSKETKAYLATLIGNLQPYKKYPESTWDQLASVTRYQHFGPGRVIIRQNHEAKALYYIVRGEVVASRVAKDLVTGDPTESNVGSMGAGDMFGEVAMLHGIPRSATVTTKTSVDFLCVQNEDFDDILRPWLLKQWDTLKDAIVSFNYFKGWDEATIRECCILSKLRNYQPNEVLLGDGKGMVNYVYFILDGKCRLIEHMVIREENLANGIKYSLYDRAENVIQPNSPERDTNVVSDKNYDEYESEILDMNYTQLLPSKQEESIDMEKPSIATLTLRDVVNEWHEITEVAALLMKQPSTISQQTYPKNVRTVFMQVCIFNRGACFGLGEKMRNRRVVSIAPTRCLLVPRYWLLEHNRANVWERVRSFIDSKYPKGNELLTKFQGNRRWSKYKQSLVQHVIDTGKRVPNSTTVHDVPYSIRINEEIDYR